MSERTVSVAEAKSHLSELNPALEAGDEVVIIKYSGTFMRRVRDSERY